MTQVYLIRHGTTEWNQEEIFRGRADCPLNDTGRAEARAVAAYLKGVEIEKIYTSPLSRAAETAETIAATRGLRIVPDPAFIDLDFGEWQGRPLKEVREKYAELYRTWRVRPQEVTFPGGENLGRVRARSWEGLLRVVRETQDKTALIVSHRVITKVLLCAALGLDDSHFWQIRQDTTAINRLEFARGRFVVSLINDTCHLKTIHPAGRRRDF
jgi:broad specificity phosphatase PhoE